MLQDNFELLLVNARHIKHVPGRKSDTIDAGWIAQLLACGLLKGSLVPPPQIRELRDLTRYRKALIYELGRDPQDSRTTWVCALAADASERENGHVAEITDDLDRATWPTG